MSKPLASYSLILLRNVRTAMASVFAARVRLPSQARSVSIMRSRSTSATVCPISKAISPVSLTIAFGTAPFSQIQAFNIFHPL